MKFPHRLDLPLFRRRDLGVAALALGTAATLGPDVSAAQGVVERLGESLKGELKDLKDDVRAEVAKLLAMEVYVYGFPLVITDLTRQVETATPTAGEYAAPIDQFARMRGYVPWDWKNVVRVSFNSLWSFAFLDLQEPKVVSFPDGKGIPTAFRLLNFWTDVVGTGGSRTPDRNAGDYLVVGPGWNGAVPPNIKEVIRCSTRYGVFIVEMAAAGPQEFPKIHPLQDQLKITPLSAWGKPYTPPAEVPVDPNADPTTTPYDQVRLMPGELYFRYLAMLLKDNPPYPADTSRLEWLRKLGIEPGKELDPSKLDPAVRKGINAAPAEVWMKFATGPFTMNAPNGWINMLTIGRFGADYQTRAYVAYMGLGAGLAEDIIYPTAFVDADGNALDAAHNYVVHFDKAFMALPGNGVWSLSAYRENFYVYNSLQRYGLPPGNPKYNADGSLDLYVQAKSPGRDKEANWLPLPPSGMFNLTIRIYNPTREALDPACKFPPIRKV
ncbi:DUF1254 domain-containing protein [Bradyrhizobium sp. CCBAU 53415]|uniref:DUF1254 domain-containing protein n=1 Tax=Bradyrhizobium sp. CCBAU 53415 TaxID=1325119 RepID=UPI0023053103|nr:DUF1214 domain-containing protein [Bradyrhizobium sp. CCBAU 53415]MDA9468272.1 membrane protein [Bradyrhizobium sp. CCBAU 53415]